MDKSTKKFDFYFRGLYIVSMAWTAQQLLDVETAIIALSSGAVRVRIGDKEYQKSSLTELRALRTEMRAEIQVSADSGLQKVVFVDREAI